MAKKILMYSTYDDHFPATNINCCGSIVNKDKGTPLKSFKRVYRGIRVAPGDYHCEPYDNGKQKVEIIQTQNGPLTVSTRYVW